MMAGDWILWCGLYVYKVKGMNGCNFFFSFSFFADGFDGRTIANETMADGDRNNDGKIMNGMIVLFAIRADIGHNLNAPQKTKYIN